MQKRKAQEQQEFYSHRLCSFSNYCPNLPPGSSREYDASIAVALLTSNTDLLPNKISLKGQHGVTAGSEPEKTSSLHKQAPSSLCSLRNVPKDIFSWYYLLTSALHFVQSTIQRVINTREGRHVM